jgi:hypothetical protein
MPRPALAPRNAATLVPALGRRHLRFVTHGRMESDAGAVSDGASNVPSACVKGVHP